MPASSVPALYFGMHRTLLHQVFWWGEEGSLERQVVSAGVTESWRPQLGLAGTLPRVDTDVPRWPGWPQRSHATAEPFSDEVIRGGVRWWKLNVSLFPMTLLQMRIDYFRIVVSHERKLHHVEKEKADENRSVGVEPDQLEQNKMSSGHVQRKIDIFSYVKPYKYT